MKTPIKRLLCGLLCASLSLPAALAANITASVTSITLPKGESTASFDLILTADKAFAGAEFGLKPSADDITLTSLEMLGEIGGNSPVQADKNGIHYFGFFTGSNAYQPGTYKVARLTYRYTGSASRTVTLTSSKIVTVDEDSKTTEGDTSSEPFTVTISRAGTTPSEGGNTSGGGAGGGGGVSGGTTVSADQTAADAVIKLINAIGTVSGNSGSAISAARSGYDALTDTQKKLVTNYNKLTQAEQVFSSLPSVGDKLPFTDMNGHWAYDAVSYAYKNSLMNGVNASRFAPDSTLNRAMMVTMLYRMTGSPAVSGNSVFSDVPSGKWYSDAVQWASVNGVVNGVGKDRFAPDTQITREQMASMMMRYAQFKQYSTGKSADLSAFNDAGSISSWALESMKWANAAGLINGRTASTIAPQDTATRAEAATILMRFCEMSK
ncbi:MAG: S-layer homology domain-containing protein [Butyricicoccus sp.]